MRLATACLFLTMGLARVSSFFNMDVVMRGGDVIYGMDELEFPKFRNGTCTVRFSTNGNFATKNGFNNGGWDSNMNCFCSSSSHPGPKTMKYKLGEDGNFVARCDSHLDYSTHTGQGHDGNYLLAIDDACILHILKGTFDCNSMNIEEEIWTNIKLEPLQRGDHLGQGEFVYNQEDGTRLLMQSGDGNLVLYKSGPTGPAHSVLWAANEEWGSPPPNRTNMHEFYTRIALNGHLTLVGIDYLSESETVYFDKDLHSGGADCFTVEYDSDQDDLVAIPCSGARRSLQLRGARA